MTRQELEARRTRYKARLEMYYQAEEQILGGAQSYSLGSRSLTRANLSEIRNAIKGLEKEIENLDSVLNGRGRVALLGGVPLDT
jgi:hypothetical protein